MNTVMIRYSKDGGHNWSDWRHGDLGERGQFMLPIEFRRFGKASVEWIFEIAVSAPVKRDIMGAVWLPEQTEV